jgi:hypothetical protein
MSQEKQKAESRRQKWASVLHFCFLLSALCFSVACQRKEPLTAQKASNIIRGYQYAHEPIYAEVPQRVWWSAKAPQDDYDGKALRTLRNLERAGLVTVSESHDNDTTSFTAHVTQKGFPILGTAPSARGPCLRATICYKKYDGLRNFERHPTDPTVGHAELVWHYENPTPMYPLFETKINKPLNKPFASYIAFYYKDFDWHFDVTVRKTEV